MSLATYQASILAVARGTYSGELDALSAADAMFSAIGRGFEQAWREGAKECGVLADERTEEESARLTLLIGEQYQYVGRFIEWIVEHNKVSGSPFEMIKARAMEWINRYVMAQTIARDMACADQKEVWEYGPTEHCCDCLRLNGRVYRNSVWQKYGLIPRSPQLACFGGHCQCQRKKTDLPITRGRPPVLRGPGGCGKAKKKEAVSSVT